MCERLKAINEYYTNLEYNESDEEKILMKISNLSKEIQYKDVDDFSERFSKTVSVIETNLDLFKSIIEHVDIITTIIEYLTTFYGKSMVFPEPSDAEYTKDELILSIILTIFNICTKSEVQLFLEDSIIKNSILDDETSQYKYLKDELLSQTNEMILLEDSDLYAVIGYLRMRKLDDVYSFDKIWVQEPIKHKFLWLIQPYYVDLYFSIHVFRSKQELFTPNKPNKMNIVSIWSEDIIAAKNLATSLNRDVIFINTHMDFYGGIILLPYTKIFDKTFKYTSLEFTDDEYDNCMIKPSVHEGPVYNLFYDGMWQQPVKGTYWKYNNSLWANATSDDIKKCVNSAEEGFKIWSAKSTKFRMDILYKFASTLRCHGKFLLADEVSKWIKFTYLFENSLFYSQSGRLEVTKIQRPRGFIVIKEKVEIILFRRLIESLVVGNSVIAICDANTCNLALYSDMFSTSKIPPGVVNLLSNENLVDLEFSLGYTEKRIKFTIPKQIILPLK